MEEKYREYDKIFATMVTNVIHADVRCGGVALSSFCPTNKVHLLFYEAAKIFVQTQNKKVYLQMGFFNYLKFKFKNFKGRYNFRRYKEKSGIELTEIEPIVNYMKESLQLRDGIFEEIYDAYFGENK